LCTWKWLWLPTRHTFGDAQSLAILGGASRAALVLLLGAIRPFWAIPVRRE